MSEEWPKWTESLRPDELTGARLRRMISAQAAPLLAARRDVWWEVASRWAGLLTPVGVAATLAFAALAVRNGATTTTERVTMAGEAPDRGSGDMFEALRSELAPPGFGAEAGADEGIVLAVLGAADRPREAELPPSSGPR